MKSSDTDDSLAIAVILVGQAGSLQSSMVRPPGPVAQVCDPGLDGEHRQRCHREERTVPDQMRSPAKESLHARTCAANAPEQGPSTYTALA